MPFILETNSLNGGEGGIRTPGTLRHTRFRVGHIRPLCHLSRDNTGSKQLINQLTLAT